MALRSFFILSPGLPTPSQFRSNVAPPLLAQQDLWEYAKVCPPSLVFRVRSESEPEAPLSVKDTLESCVGVVDSATRWRTVFKMAYSLLPAILHPQLNEACSRALQFLSSAHPAGVQPAQRRAIMAELAKICSVEGPDSPNGFEVRVADGVAMLSQCDSDMEAAQCAPFLGALVPFHQEKQAKEFAARMATIETMSGALLLSEAAARLGERLPQWLLSRMPDLALPGTDAPEKDEDDEA